MARTIMLHSLVPAGLSSLSEGGGAEAVDAAAAHIQKKGRSSQKRKNGQSSLPISLFSKVGFFLCPTRLVPLDRYAVRG